MLNVVIIGELAFSHERINLRPATNHFIIMSKVVNANVAKILHADILQASTIIFCFCLRLGNSVIKTICVKQYDSFLKGHRFLTALDEAVLRVRLNNPFFGKLFGFGWSGGW